VRAAVEAASLAELPHRAGRAWAAVDARQLPYWGRGEPARFLKGWSGTHSRRLRGYRLHPAVDTEPGQVITFLLACGRGRDARLLPALARGLRRLLGRRLARAYRQRWRAEQAIEELLNGHDLDHRVGYRLHPNRVAVGLRLLARNRAIGRQIEAAGRRPAVIREPRAFRAGQVGGLDAYRVDRGVIVLTARRRAGAHACHLPWTGGLLRCVA
jgi:hypothetical protein